MKRARPTLLPTPPPDGRVAVVALRCPQCGGEVSLQASVAEFGQPSSWHFWGRAGERWIKCRGEQRGVDFVHFITLLDGAPNHRLAWITTPPEDAADKQIPLFT